LLDYWRTTGGLGLREKPMEARRLGSGASHLYVFQKKKDDHGRGRNVPTIAKHTQLGGKTPLGGRTGGKRDTGEKKKGIKEKKRPNEYKPRPLQS